MARPRKTPESGYSDKWETIDDLRAGVQAMREEADKMLAHLQRLIVEYGDFEDRILEIDRHIEQLEKDSSIKREDIEKPIDPAEEYINLDD